MLSRRSTSHPAPAPVGGHYHAEGAYAPVSFVTFTSTVIPRKLEALPE